MMDINDGRNWTGINNKIHAWSMTVLKYSWCSYSCFWKDM
jgi:hypothetical protein